MRRTIACIALLVGLALPACIAQDDFPILVYPAPEAKTPPKIDGLLNDACWEDAPLVSGFTLYNKPVAAQVQTALRVTYDREFVYFAVRCTEPLSDEVSPQKTARDNHNIFREETVEFFIDPRHDHTDYYQFAVSVGGGLWDSKKSNSVWNADIKAGTRLGKGYWSVELAVPWVDLGVTPRPAMVVGFNVCRDRHVGGKREWTNWSQTKANFHDPARFAHLVLSPGPEELGKLIDEFRKGDRSGPILVFGSEGFAGTSYRQMAQTSIKQVEGQVDQLAQVRAREKDPATRAELGKRIAAYRRQLASIRERLDSSETTDAVQWTELNQQLNELSKRIAIAIWDARLSALLSGI